MSHVVFPSNFTDGTPCPNSHPVAIPQLFFETAWDTRQFNDLELWPEDPSKQPFVLSNWDRKGYDFHADFLSGWKEGALERAVKDFSAGCVQNVEVCLGLTSQNKTIARTCTKEQAVKEDLEGWLDELPGGVQLYG
jgi:hypothetical protein